MTIITKDEKNILLISIHEQITSSSIFLDKVTDALYYHDCSAVIVHEQSLSDTFFDLKTGVAGEILQKCSTYGIKLAIIGDFEKYKSKSLKAFISESNNGNGVFFKKTLEDGIHAISNPKRP